MDKISNNLTCECIGCNIFSMVAIPVYLKHNISFKDGNNGRLDITVGPKQTMGKNVSMKCIQNTSRLMGGN